MWTINVSSKTQTRASLQIRAVSKNNDEELIAAQSWFWRSLETHISNHSARSSDNRNTNKHTLILAGTVKSFDNTTIMSETHQSSISGSAHDAFAVSSPAAAPDRHLVVVIHVFKRAFHIDWLPVVSRWNFKQLHKKTTLRSNFNPTFNYVPQQSLIAKTRLFLQLFFLTAPLSEHLTPATLSKTHIYKLT